MQQKFATWTKSVAFDLVAFDSLRQVNVTVTVTQISEFGKARCKKLRCQPKFQPILLSTSSPI
jgi:hypothetical protein